jgi:hypothetical protein
MTRKHGINQRTYVASLGQVIKKDGQVCALYFQHHVIIVLGAPSSSSSSHHGWQQMEHILEGLAGIPRVFLRISFGADSQCCTGDGFAFDDVEIFEGNVTLCDVLTQFYKAPIGVVPTCTELVFPPDGYSLHHNAVTLKWKRVETQLGLPLGYFLRVDEEVYIIDNPETTSLFIQSISTNQEHTWQVIPFGYNNITPSQCPQWTFQMTQNRIYITPTSPYIETFENGPAGWTVQGTYWSLSSMPLLVLFNEI